MESKVGTFQVYEDIWICYFWFDGFHHLHRLKTTYKYWCPFRRASSCKWSFIIQRMRVNFIDLVMHELEAFPFLFAIQYFSAQHAKLGKSQMVWQKGAPNEIESCQLPLCEKFLIVLYFVLQIVYCCTKFVK